MRYGIFSDIHSNLEALDTVINAYKKESIDKYFCIGDVIGYAANPNEVIKKVKEIAMITVAGNHDWAVIDLFPAKYFNPVAFKAINWTAQVLNEDNKLFLKTLKLIYLNEELTLVHGTLNNAAEFDYMMNFYKAEETFKLMQTPVCFIGHTHVPGCFIRDKNGNLNYSNAEHIIIEQGNKYIINVGSVGQPRDRNPRAAYCIYDTGKKEAWVRRIDYDIQTARDKIIDAGLPPSLGNRLMRGI